MYTLSFKSDMKFESKKLCFSIMNCNGHLQYDCHRFPCVLCFWTFILYCFMPLVPVSSFVVLLVPPVSSSSFAPVSCYPDRLSVYLNSSGSCVVCQLLSFVECVVILCSLTLSSAPVIPVFCSLSLDYCSTK